MDGENVGVHAFGYHRPARADVFGLVDFVFGEGTGVEDVTVSGSDSHGPKVGVGGA